MSAQATTKTSPTSPTAPVAAAGTSLRVRVQRFGTFLSGMVMPNIGVFIAWGFLAAFFIPTGWLPNERLGSLVEPVITYLIPVLIGYTGGRMVHGARGGAIGAIATMGVVVGADVTMLVGGMVMGPLAALVLKKFDRLIEGRVRPGLEMLVDNFSIGIFGFVFAIAGFEFVTPVFSVLLSGLSIGMSFLIDHGLLPLTSLLVQQAKILFLNNAVNHGVMIPLGVEQVSDTGKSILFLVEANGGVWTGVAVAFAIFARGTLKRSAPAAALIMFLGGIAEVVFAYVLAKPKTLLGPIAGNMAGLLTLGVLGGGTVGAVSPASIIALIAMSPRGGLLPNLAGYAVAFVVTVAVTGLMILTDRRKDAAEELAAHGSDPEPGSQGEETSVSRGSMPEIRAMIFACDAGMGSSVMGTSRMRAKLRAAGLDVSIEHSAVKDIPTDADAVITSVSLADRVRATLHAQGRDDVPVFPLNNLLSDQEYDGIIEKLGNRAPEPAEAAPGTRESDSPGRVTATHEGRGDGTDLLDRDLIVLGAKFSDKWEAIRAAGDLLVRGGRVEREYVDTMIAREETATVYVGNNLAIPHGTQGSEELIRRSGIACLQVPDGVRFGDEMAYVIIAIAGRDGAHLGILSSIALTFADEANVRRVREAEDASEILDLLASAEPSAG